MPPQINPLPQLIPPRLLHLRNLLAKQLWEQRRDLEVWRSPKLDPPLPSSRAAGLEYKPIRPGEYFGPPGGDWQQVWFKVPIPAPAPGEAGRRYFFWDSHGETTAYLDGRPWAGLDVAHRYCRLPDSAGTLWLDTAVYQTCIWHAGSKPLDEFGLRFSGAWLECRRSPEWETYWDLVTLTDWLGALLKRDRLENMLAPWGTRPQPDSLHPVARRLLAMLDGAFQAWETGGVAALAPVLKTTLAAFPSESWQPRINMIGQSHLDLVWMWPEAEGERKAIHTMATALRLLEEYPAFRFLWTSPHTMKMLSERFPEMEQEIRSQIKAGRWEATGGAWVEFDTLIPCGEALSRSLALGQRWFAKLRGVPSTTVWLPDCFGFNAFLPQIMALAGIRNFFTLKLHWNAINRFPYDSFVWRSADGSEVLTHLCVTGGEQAAGLMDAAANYRELALHPEVIQLTGAGDGGGGPTVERIESLHRLGNLAQVPPVAWGTVEGFFDRLGQVRDRLPVYAGELYLEFHRGIYTSRAEFKRRYRRLERALQAWEAARVLSGGGAIPESSWERLCFAQFHDALPGSSFQIVYNRLGPELDELADRALAQAQADLGQPGAPSAVFNPLAIERTAVVALAAPPAAPDGWQRSGDAWLAAVRLPPLGVTPLRPLPAPAWEVSPRVLDNGRLRVEFDAHGRLVKAAGADGAWPLAAPPQLLLHPDNPPTFDAWEIDHNALRQTVGSLPDLDLAVMAGGPARAILAGRARLGRESSLEIRYLLDAGEELLRVELDVDWREEHRVLRFYLPSGLRGRMARFAAPYGSVVRPQTPGGQLEEAMWEVPASRWAAVTDDTGARGLAIVTEAKYGFGCRDGELALTLLRAPEDPALESKPHEMPRRECPQHSVERGRHRIRFALGRFRPAGGRECLSTAAQAEALYAPAPAGAFAVRTAPFSFAGELGTLVPCWTLPARDGRGFILRLNETMGAAGSIRIDFPAPPRALELVDFLERPLPDAALVRLAAQSCRLDYRPYQIISLRVTQG